MAEPRELAALGRHWDAVLRGIPAPTPIELDPALAETVARLHAVDDLPYPDDVFAARLWNELRVSGGRGHGGPAAPVTGPAPLYGRPPDAAPVPLARPPRRLGRVWGVLELAAAVLLLLVPLSGYLVGYRVLPELAALWRDDERGNQAVDVPLDRGDAARTGAMPGPGPDGSPIEIWRLDPQIGESTYFSPVVVDGLVYLGTSAGTLVALDAETGQERWRFTTESRAIVSEAPAIADGTVYVGSGDGNVYALDAATGAERWRAPVGSAYGAPVVVDGVVYVAHTTNFNERPYPAVADGLVVINGCACGGLHALAANSGQKLWTHTPSANGLYALDPATGAERWHRPPGVNPPTMYYPVPAMISAPAIGEGMVYVVEADAALLAVDAASGEERWRHTLTDSAGVNMIARSAPAVVAGVVYVGAIDGKLHAVDALTGEPRWVVPLGYWIASSPAVAEGIVYVGTMDGSIHAVDAATGAGRWEYLIGSAVTGSPVVANGALYVVDVTGVLFALANAPPGGGARASPGP